MNRKQFLKNLLIVFVFIFGGKKISAATKPKLFTKGKFLDYRYKTNPNNSNLVDACFYDRYTSDENDYILKITESMTLYANPKHQPKPIAEYKGERLSGVRAYKLKHHYLNERIDGSHVVSDGHWVTVEIFY